MNKPIMSICIPTYNRGKFAYAAAKHLLDNWDGDEIEVVVSDNNSSDNTQELILSIHDKRLKYFRNDTNMGAAYNTHLAFMRATGEYAYLTSDEDDLDIDEIPFLLDYFEKNSNVSVFIGGGNLTYTKKRFLDAVYAKAFNALKAIAFKTRYMTGIIMQQKKYSEQMGKITFEESAEKWDAYSFMYAIARLCCCGDVVTSSHLLFSQTRLRMTDISNNARKDGVYYYEPQGRLDQMYTWSKAICDLPITMYEKQYMVIKIIFDTVELANQIFTSSYIDEVRKTVLSSDYAIYKQRIASIDKAGLTDSILKKGCEMFHELFGHEIEVSEDKRVVEYYNERIKGRVQDNNMSNLIALYGGKPTRKEKIFYGKQLIFEEDISQVESVLRSDWLTQGPKVKELENKLCGCFGAKYAVTSTNGTSALHLACIAAGISDEDEVITTPITFAATSNCIRYCGGKVVYADILPNTYNIDPASVEEKITSKTKAVIAVDYAGQPVQLKELRKICNEHNLILIEDAAHSLGSKYCGEFIGSIADITTFSFHPVKTITGGEGGAVLTNRKDYYDKIRLAASHGITKDAETFAFLDNADCPWYCEQQLLGYNYRMTEMQAALIISQLNKLESFKKRRKDIVDTYNQAFRDLAGINLPWQIEEADTCWHLYVIGINASVLGCDRKLFFEALAAENIQPQVHYVPVYLHPYYRKIGHYVGECPNAESAYAEIMSLPLYPAMTEEDIFDVITAVRKVYKYFEREKGK